MDRFESMSAFVAVAQTGSFSAASRRLGAPLASVSRNVSELEERLGVRLLARSSRKVALTESGRRFFEGSRAILERLVEAERAAAGECHTPRGKLVITVPIALGRRYVVPIVAEFLNVFRDVEIDLRLTSRFFNLAKAGIDLALYVGNLPETGQPATCVGGIGLVISASPDYLAERGTPIHPLDVAGHDCVTFFGVGAEGAIEWPFKIEGVLTSAPVHSRLRVTTAEAAIEAAMAGAGLIRTGTLPVAQAIAEGQLALVLAGYEPDPLPVHILLPADRPPPLKLRAFLDFLTPRLEARLRALAEALVP